MSEALLPHDKEAEQGTLGAILHDPKLLPTVAGVVTPNHFFSPAHREIFKGMLTLVDLGEPLDELTLAHYFRVHDKLEQVGGMVYLAELQDMTPVSGNALAYALIVHQMWLRRSFITSCLDMAKKARESQEPTEQLLVQTEQVISDLLRTSPGLESKSQKQLVEEWWHRQEHPEQRSFVTTGTYLDRYLGRLSISRAIYIAGRPGQGKTALSRCLAMFLAQQMSVPSIYHNLEMDEEEMVERDIAGESQVDSLSLRDPQQKLVGTNDDGDEVADTSAWDRVMKALDSLGRVPLYTYTPPRFAGLQRIEAVTRFGMQKYGVRVAFIDQLSKISMGSKMTPYERQTARAEGITRLIKKLRIPFLVNCQINRKGAEEPTLEDLKDSGQIEEDAHAVILVHAPFPDVREARTGTERDEMETRIKCWNDWRYVKIIIAKNGGGKTGEFMAMFYPKTQTFDFQPDKTKK